MSKEIETTLDESSVTAGAKPADPQGKLENDGSGLAGVTDLGGPTPQNSKPDDESNKYKIVGKSATPLPPNLLPLQVRKLSSARRVMYKHPTNPRVK